MGPLLFFPLMFYGKIGGVWLLLITIFSCVIQGVITELGKYSLSWMIMDPMVTNDWMYWLYYNFWSRMTPYLVGLWTGYLVYRINKNPIKMELWQVALGWITAIVVGLLVVYGVYP